MGMVQLPYSLTTLWFERRQYLPGILAVTFSALLIHLQCGLLLGLFSISSLPVDHTDADIWLGSPNIRSVDLGRPIPETTLAQLSCQPEIESCELYYQGYAYWSKRDGGSELCMVIGARLGLDRLGHRPMGAVKELTEEMRVLLQEPGAVVCDESDRERLNIKGEGDYAEVAGVRVRVVKLTRGVKSIAGPHVVCSVATARRLLQRHGVNTTYFVLARLKPEHKKDAKLVVNRLNQPGNQTRWIAYTRDQFSLSSRVYWLTRTKAGIALGYTAALGLLVGGVVTSQTLFSATTARLREFAVLRALGIPRIRMVGFVLAQSFWIGAVGVIPAIPLAWLMKLAAGLAGAEVQLPWWLLLGASAITMLVALFSGSLALRSLRSAQPAMLLR